MSWQGFPPSSPRPVDGGLTAHSTRGDIGEHWWSRRFVDVMESFALGTRLTRGRSYARKGQVISLSVAPGVVTASVQGSRRAPYQVRVTLAPFPRLVWAKVEVALAERAVHSAVLLAGQMPPDLEEVFAASGAPLFPSRVTELGMSCSCPDGAVPCKHLAACFYLLAERFDDDPFEILHWRGRRRTDLLARLADLRGDADGPGADSVADGADDGADDAAGAGGRGLPPASAAAVLAAAAAARRTGASTGDGDIDGDIDGDAAQTWAPPVTVPALPTSAALPVDLLLRQLPPAPSVLGGRALDEELAAAYLALQESTTTAAPPRQR